MANLRATRDAMPALERVWTWNASSNEHMLAINIAMGFRPERLWTECQLRLPPRRDPLAQTETETYLAELVAEVGEPSPDERSRAEAIARRIAESHATRVGS